MTFRKLCVFTALASLSIAGFAQEPTGDAENNLPHKAGAMAEGGHQQGANGMRGGGQMKMSRERHHFARDNGIGEAYRGRTNPITATDDDLLIGKGLYGANCASCHGDTGVGDGAAGAALDPEPTNIARFAKMRMAKDDYLLWTISDGGDAVGSAMPAFKAVLDEVEIWRLVSYLRQL